MAKEQETAQKARKAQDMERIANPEQLDQLMQVVSVREWVPLAALGAVVATILAWSIVGAIPVNVQGRGALIYPRFQAGTAAVAQFQSAGSGRLIDLRVVRGDHVSKGMLMAVVEQPELRKNLEIAREKRDELLTQQAAARPLQQRVDENQLKALHDQRQSLVTKIADATAILHTANQGAMQAVDMETRNLKRRLADTIRERSRAKRNFDAQAKLRGLGLISDQVYSEAERQYLDSDRAINDLQAQIAQQAGRRLEARRTADSNTSSVVDLRAQLVELDSRIKNQDLASRQASQGASGALREAERQIDQLEHELRNNSFVLSDYDGTILEVSALVGQLVAPGTPLGAIEVSSQVLGSQADGTLGPSHTHAGLLQAVSYFTVGDGKRIHTGMPVQITPDTVKREEFGGILGRVTSVSAFPVSAQGAVNLLNSTDVAAEVTAGGHTIEVLADLDPDEAAFSGYRWSSSGGPKLKLSAGTTSTMRVTIKRDHPISLVLPMLKQFTGVY